MREHFGHSGLFREAICGVLDGGHLSWGQWAVTGVAETSPETVFDLASLTKPCLGSMAVEFHELGDLKLQTRVADLWKHVPRDVTLADLLSHRSGLRAWHPFYKDWERAAPLDSRNRDAQILEAQSLDGQSRPQFVLEVLASREQWDQNGRVYSDLGPVLWGVLAEKTLGADLETLWEQSRVGRDARALGWSPCGGDVRTSPMDTSKEVELALRLGLQVENLGPPEPRQVQDGNARFLGAAAHAGLFGSLEAVATWLQTSVMEQDVRYRSLLRLDRPETSLIWFRSGPGSSASAAASARAFGHTGFAGSSVWIDPESSRVSIVLASRNDPTQGITAARRGLNGVLLGPRLDW